MRMAAVVTLLASPRLAVSAEDALSEAKVAFQHGLEAYDAHEYAEALISFQRSFALSHRPEILFDIAETQAALGNCASAVQNLDQLVREANDSPALVERANARRRELLPCAPPPTPPVTETASSQPARSVAIHAAVANPDSSPRSPDRVAMTASPGGQSRSHRGGWNALFWGAAGASVACAAAGVVVGLNARASGQNVEAATTWDSAQVREDERGRALSATSAGLLLAAAAAAATSIVAYVIARRHP
ncbi:MAG TPA: hypothetical protein VN962_06065 [Polyangia bacterium]|nr:hypothetical protein [Polyangia bacterium]